MQNILFENLYLNDWKESRDILHKYGQMVGAIRENFSEPHPHWWHISLYVSDNGLTTTPLPVAKDSADKTFEVILDLQNHKLKIASNYRELKQISLTGQSLSALCEETCSLLSDIGVEIRIDKEKFTDGKAGEYNEAAVSNYWNSLKEINRIMNKFRAELSGERSPVQLWSHHFDLAMSWYSGRLIPEKDPDDAELSKEQMMFGFSTGDNGIPDAYFYITTYPIPRDFPNFDIPADARWNTEGFSGGVLMYETLLKSDNHEKLLLNYFRTFQKAGAELMK
ncbi:MAG: hypothetical protein KJO59_07515 [Ignavibacteria bacterium]|nr:hypothetical protein [Ignavibacteria bacterium]